VGDDLISNSMHSSEQHECKHADTSLNVQGQQDVKTEMVHQHIPPRQKICAEPGWHAARVYRLVLSLREATLTVSATNAAANTAQALYARVSNRAPCERQQSVSPVLSLNHLVVPVLPHLDLVAMHINTIVFSLSHAVHCWPTWNEPSPPSLRAAAMAAMTPPDGRMA